MTAPASHNLPVPHNSSPNILIGHLHPQPTPLGARRVTVFCWRCWRTYPLFVTDEFSECVLFRCERCGAMRISDTGGALEYAYQKFLDVHHPSGMDGPNPAAYRRFTRMLENKWLTPCRCGGRFRQQCWPNCPCCQAKPKRWLSVTAHPVIALDGLQPVEIRIPPRYVFAAPRPVSPSPACSHSSTDAPAESTQRKSACLC